jgi:2'-hydroxyisoflavone reductase
MPLNRREWLKLGLLAAAGGSVLRAPFARASDAQAPARPLRILILGGTGFTGPHQVRYALARGHKVTLFNRGKRPQDWPAGVEELTGDRNTGDLKSLAGREWDVCIDNPTTLPFWVRDAGRALHGRVGHTSSSRRFPCTRTVRPRVRAKTRRSRPTPARTLTRKRRTH